MKTKLIQNKIFVKKSRTHGYGVFAGKRIKKGEIVEQCYIIVSKKGGDKALEDFYFDANGKHAVLLGFGMIYNHANKPNVNYTINVTKRIATIKAARNIKKGEELFVSYGEEWFKDRNLLPK